MPRRPTGQVLERERDGGRIFALRFRAYGERRYVTLGSSAEGWTRKKAEEGLANVLADVRREIWQPPKPEMRAAHRLSRPSTSSPRSGSRRDDTSSRRVPARITN